MAKTGSTCMTIDTELAQIKLGGDFLSSAAALNKEGAYLLFKKTPVSAAAIQTTTPTELLAASEVPTGYYATCLSATMVFHASTALVGSGDATAAFAIYETGSPGTKTLLYVVDSNTTGVKSNGSTNCAYGTQWPTLSATATGASCSMLSAEDGTGSVIASDNTANAFTVYTYWLIWPA